MNRISVKEPRRFSRHMPRKRFLTELGEIKRLVEVKKNKTSNCNILPKLCYHNISGEQQCNKRPANSNGEYHGSAKRIKLQTTMSHDNHLYTSHYSSRISASDVKPVQATGPDLLQMCGSQGQILKQTQQYQINKQIHSRYLRDFSNNIHINPTSKLIQKQITNEPRRLHEARDPILALIKKEIFDKTQGLHLASINKEYFEESQDSIFASIKEKLSDKSHESIITTIKREIFEETKQINLALNKKEVSGEAENPVVASIKKEISDETQNTIIVSIKKEISDETQNPIIASIKKESYNEAQNPIIASIKKEIYNEAQNQLFALVKKEMCDETAIIASINKDSSDEPQTSIATSIKKDSDYFEEVKWANTENNPRSINSNWNLCDGGYNKNYTYFTSNYKTVANKHVTNVTSLLPNNNITTAQTCHYDNSTSYEQELQNNNAYNSIDLYRPQSFENALFCNSYVVPLLSRPAGARFYIPKVGEPEYTDILHAPKKASKDVIHRMETAVEAILSMTHNTNHTSDDAHENFAHQKQLRRYIKPIVRQRIKNILRGNVVGSSQDIIASYRQKYPIERDSDLATSFTDFESFNVVCTKTEFIQSDDPEDFFHLNIKRLINTQINKLVNLVEKKYVNAEMELQNLIEQKSMKKSKGTIEEEEMYKEKIMNLMIESGLARVLKSIKNEIVNIQYHKEVCQAIGMKILKKS